MIFSGSKRKKGNVFLETIIVIVLLLGMGLVGLIAHNIFGQLNDAIQEDTTLQNKTKEDVDSLYNRNDNFLDGIMLLLFILLWAMVILSSFLIDSHPAFFIFTIILVGILLFIGAILANTWEEIASTSEFGATATDLPITNFILSNLGIHALVIGFIVSIILFAKVRT